MTTPNGAIVFNASTGSDSAASGLGPATAQTGSGASTDGTAVVTGITTTGVSAGDLLWVQTASGRQFSIIASVDSGTQVTCDDTFVLGSGQTWAIGGKRATFDNADSRQAFTDAATLKWVFETETSQTITSTIVIDEVVIVGTSTDPSTRQTVDCSASNTHNFQSSGGNVFRNIKFTNSNATKTSGSGYRIAANGTSVFVNCEFGDATDKLYNATSRSTGVDNIEFHNCFIHNTVGNGISMGGNTQPKIFNTVFYKTGDVAASMSNGVTWMVGCVFLDCGGSNAFVSNRECKILNTMFHTATGGVSFDGGVIVNCVFYNLTTGFNATSVTNASIYDHNYFGSVTTHAVISGNGESTNEQTLTADPCVDATNGDATLNETSGGGADLRSAAVTLGSTETRPFRWLDTSTGGATLASDARIERLK